MKSKSFSEKCYEVLKKVPKGKITTYKDLAKAMKSKAYRAVGTLMKKNPHAPKVPCHRVVKNNGEVGEFASGNKNKIKLLKKEGILIKNNKVQNLDNVLFKFNKKP